jgi:elongation factor P--(R)-beta-lysine ligase
MNIDNLKIRSDILQVIRGFFLGRGFYEVDSAINIRYPANEMFIDSPVLVDGSFLRTSPELDMKRVVCAGMEKIFQIGSCFRNGEQGDFHNPEFTMLEWYRAHSNYMDILADTKELIREIALEICGKTIIVYNGNEIDLNSWVTIPVDSAFEKLAGWVPSKNFNQDRFDLDLVNKVEPELPIRPVVLKDYPVEAGALAKVKEDNSFIAERWELYIGGMEIANAYSELTDPVEQRMRFEEASRKRVDMGSVAYPIDEDFMSCLANGMPECGGIALGIDRLVMLFCDAKSIDEVRVN